jgi:hypothetical protein
LQDHMVKKASKLLGKQVNSQGTNSCDGAIYKFFEKPVDSESRLDL